MSMLWCFGSYEPSSGLGRMILSDLSSLIDFWWNAKQRGNIIYTEKGGNHLINKSAFVFKNMSRDCLRQWRGRNRIIKRNNELKEERRRKEGKKRKENTRRMR